MRLGVSVKESMKKKILSDLYDKNLSRVREEREQIVRDNYLEWLAEYQPRIDALPAGFIQTGRNAVMDISDFDWANDFSDKTWSASFEKEVPACIVQDPVNTWRQTNIPVKPSDTYRQLADDNQTEYDKLLMERIETDKYIDKSYEQCTSTTQLRKFWPQALHKYIPPEPPRAARQKKELDTSATDDIADTLTQRLANNLLED